MPKAGRRYTVDTHPKKAMIIKALLRGDGFRDIAGKYGVPKSCLHSYLEVHIAEQVAKLRAEEQTALAKEADSTLKGNIEYVMQRMRKLYDACDEYLQDPDNPGKYDLHPRAWEFDVVYREVEPDTGRMITKKASLAWLLEKVDEQGYQPWEVKMKSADPRNLIVQTANAIAKQLELLAKLEGKISGQVVNITNYNQSYLELKALVINVTKDYPDIQKRIIEGLGNA